MNSIKAKNGWEEIFTAVDSGASETVVGEEMLEVGRQRRGKLVDEEYNTKSRTEFASRT